MQLPRGTFREIKRGVRISDLLDEVERIGFSGICNISYGTENVTLVFRSGKCILADFLGRHGDSAWEELRNSADQEIDAALSTLDEAQIQLSLEFNKSSRIVKTGRPAAPGTPALHGAPAGRTPVEVPRKTGIHPPPVSPVAPVKPPIRSGSLKSPASQNFHEPVRPRAAEPAPLHRPVIAEKHPAPSSIPQAPEQIKSRGEPLPPHHRPVITGKHPANPASRSPADLVQPNQGEPAALHKPVIGQKHPAGSPPEPDKIPPEVGPENPVTGEETGAESDFDSFDSMDLENVADKIRSDCKTMIKHLHLEHLMER